MVKTATAISLIFLLTSLSTNVCGRVVLYQSRSDRLEKHSAHEQARGAKERALWILRDIIVQANSAETIRDEASVVSGAAELLWIHDQKYARDSYNRMLTTLLQEYETEAAKPDSNKLNKLGNAITTIIKSFARRDSKAALVMLEKYQQTRNKALDSSVANQSPKEKFEVVREGLDLDPKGSANMAARILKSGIPSTFPQYLYDLEMRDSHAANSLYQTALSLVASGTSYSSQEINLLSAYPFRESAIIVPATQPSNNNQERWGVGIFTSPLQMVGENPQVDLRLARDYVTVAYPYLLRVRSTDAAEPASQARNLFLAHKLTGYVTRLNLDDPLRWQELDLGFQTTAKNSGLDDANVQYIAGYADRIANDQVAFIFDNGASYFRKAEETKNQHCRTQLIVRGIKELVEGKLFEEAKKRVATIDDQEIQKQLSDYVNYKAGEAAAVSHDWSALLESSGSISDNQLHALLMLKAARFAKDSGKTKAIKQLTLELLDRAVADLSREPESACKAKGLLATAALLSTIDPDKSLAVVNDAIDALNKSANFDCDNFGVQVSIAGVRMDFWLSNSNMESAFENIAKVDWLEVVALIQRLDSKPLRNRAHLGACRTILA